MEIEIPDFMNKEFFKEFLKSYLHDIQINKFDIAMGSNIGENYFSKIFRVSIDFEKAFIENNHKNVNENAMEYVDKSLSLIVKYLPIKGRRPFGENLKIYSKEIEMYETIIPNLEIILNNKIRLAPKFYGTLPDPTRILVFQDLKSMGYVLADRTIGLDENHAKVVMKKIAQFHAASICLAKKNLNTLKKFDYGFLSNVNRETTLQKNIFEGNLECMEEVLNKFQDEKEKYKLIAIKLKNLKENFLDKCLEICKTNDNELKVLNHGDLHLNNFMFKYNLNNQPCDVIFIDLQLCYYGSLGLDINYFFNTSLQLDVLKLKRSELLNCYYTSLKDTLENLNYEPIYSFENVLAEVNNKEFYGFFAFEGIFPTLSMPDCRFNNIDQYSYDEILTKRRKIMFSSGKLQEYMKYSLDRFNKLGILD